MIREGAARQEVDLQGSDESLLIARLDPGRRGRVNTSQHPVETLDAAPGGNRVQAGAAGGVTTGSREQAARQSTEVKTGPAGDNREPTARVDIADDGRRVMRVLRGRVLTGRVDDVDQMMRNAAAISQRHFVGANIETTSDSRRIAVDDLAVVALGDCQRQRACRWRSARGPRRRTGGSPDAEHHVDNERDQQQHQPRCWDLVMAGIRCRRTSR